MTELPDFTWLFIKMTSGLVLVLGLAFIFIRFVLPKTRLFRSKNQSWMSVLGRVPMDSHRHLYLVKIFQRYFVLGSAENSVNLVAEFSASEVGELELKDEKEI